LEGRGDGSSSTAKGGEVVPLVLERDEYEALKRLAHAQRTSVSALIRELVGQYLKTAERCRQPRAATGAATAR
jgi:Ribbon-helix-helix protein, copG family.